VDTIFGLSVTTIMVVLLIMLALCLLAVAWVALTKPVVFKLGMRNIPRRKAQTVLIVVGLMLATLISSAALGMGDTIDYSLSSAAFEALGEVDEVVVFSPDVEANINAVLGTEIPASALGLVEGALAGDPNVDGIMPLALEFVPAINTRSEQTTPEVFLAGIDPARLDQFGGLRTPDGETIDLAGLAEGGVVISESTAEELDARIGDPLVVSYANRPVSFTVAAIAENGPLSGVLNANANPGLVIPLARLQALTGNTDTLTGIAISNTGGVRDGLERTDAVEAKLAPVLEGQNLGIDPIKQTSIAQSEEFSSGFTGLFLVLGLFSISVGILLIILIFTMLAAERRPEMGMARAVGQQRRQLVQQFVAEGTGYAILAGLVGSALGVLVTYLLAVGLGSLIGEFFTVTPRVTPRSLVIGYCLGVVITFAAVVVSSWRISRLNVVAAIRDLPDVETTRRRKRTLVFAALLIGGGALLALAGQTGESARAFLFYGGMSLVPFGVALLLRWLGIAGRLVYSLVGLYILVLWLLPPGISEDLFGDLGGDFEMFFLSGVFMVAGASLLIVNNLDLLLAGASALGGLFKDKLPAVRTAIAYPGAAKSRTGLTIAMFSLIVFSLVAFATINANFVNLFLGDEADAGWDVRVDVPATNPIPNDDLAAALAASGQGVTTDDFAATGWAKVGSFLAQVRQVGGTDQEFADYGVTGVNEGFLDGVEVSFQQRAEGYADDAAVLEALRTEPDAVVVDALALEGAEGFGPTDGFQLEGVTLDDKTFPAVPIEVRNPAGQTATFRVIGVIDQDISTLFGLFGNQASIARVFPEPQLTSYFARLSDPEAADEKARAMEAALITYGAQGTSIRGELEEQQEQSQGFLYLIQGFMGLGLLVGVAAVGVIAFRAVVERRQQIGVLRAIGYQQSMVALSFIIETLFVVGLGVLSGTILAIVLARNLFSDEAFTGGSEIDFVVPWGLIAVLLAITFVAAVLMTWVPSRQASRIAPAEALRYE
jgi:putative ABC transport system permease protein